VFPDQNANASGASGYHRWLVNPALLLPRPELIKRTTHIAVPLSPMSLNDVYTQGLTAYTLEVVRQSFCPKKHTYLRWIDRRGRYCYWLFYNETKTHKVSATAWETAGTDNPLQYNDGFNSQSRARQSLASSHTNTLVEPFVKRCEIPLLMSLLESPVVDEFDGFSKDETLLPMWHRVNIGSGSTTDKNIDLQELSFSITEPQTESQIL
jgi:hypothetical protein